MGEDRERQFKGLERARGEGKGAEIGQRVPASDWGSRRSRTALRFQEGQQIGVNGIGLGRRHAVRKALVGFQCAILQQF